jgi:uncharacterized protein (TIGR02271 family)
MEKKTRPPTFPDSPASGTPEAGLSRDADSGVLRLLAEEAKVSRQTVETGRVRVAKVTRTRDHLVDEVLGRTAVEVNRVPIGRLIEKMPAIKEDGDVTVIPIVEETFVVQRRLMLKEELHIRRVHTTERFQQTVQLRYQTAEVTRTPAQKPAGDNDAMVGSIPKRNPEDT